MALMSFLSYQTPLSPVHVTVFSAEKPISAFCAGVTTVNDDETAGPVSMTGLLVPMCTWKPLIHVFLMDASQEKKHEEIHNQAIGYN